MQEEPTPLCEWHEGWEYDNCEPCEAAWDACVASIQYESGEPVEVVLSTNPYRKSGEA